MEHVDFNILYACIYIYIYTNMCTLYKITCSVGTTSRYNRSYSLVIYFMCVSIDSNYYSCWYILSMSIIWLAKLYTVVSIGSEYLCDTQSSEGLYNNK